MANMNEFSSRAQGFRYYEQLKDVVNINDPRPWAQGFRCYEQLRATNDI